MGTRAFLGIGTNLGDRLANLQRAVDILAGTSGLRFVRSSRVYETDPVGPPQPDFLIIVAEVDTDLSARDLLGVVARIEVELHRVRLEHWGPRTIDVDILTFDAETIDEPDLVVPHPRMHERAFVLLPLLELEADPMLPGGRRVSTTPLGPGALEGARVFAPPLLAGAS
jgi:2-amino-4-hydroxy-6-hydroxymethyldihydropteridine diphosphokinase